MFRDLWFTVSSTDVFIPLMFVCMIISIALKLCHWKEECSGIRCLMQQILDCIYAGILICCFIPSQLTEINYPMLIVVLLMSLFYCVIVLAYILRRIMPSTEFYDTENIEPENNYTEYLDDSSEPWAEYEKYLGDSDTIDYYLREAERLRRRARTIVQNRK